MDGLDKKIGNHGTGSGANSHAEGKSRNGLNGGNSVTENESFNRHYNKELKVSEGNYLLPLKLIRRNTHCLA